MKSMLMPDRSLAVPSHVAAKMAKEKPAPASPIQRVEWVLFPDADPGCKPLWWRVLVQIVQPKTGSEYLAYTQDTQEADRYNKTVGKVITVGPLVGRDRKTGERWKGVDDCDLPKPGDYVRIPKGGGDRFERTSMDGKHTVHFAIFNDDDVLAVCTGDPATFKGYV